VQSSECSTVPEVTFKTSFEQPQKNSLNTEAVKQSSLVTASRPQVEPVGTVSMAQDDSSTTKQIGNNVSNQTSPYRQMLCSGAAGAMGGAVAKTTIAPLDRTKIYFQTHPERRYRIKGAIKFLILTYKQDGIFSLWRGNSATMLRVIPYASISFMSHEQYKKLLGISNGTTSLTPNERHKRHFMAGSLAGTTGQALTYPLDRARAVMAVTKVGEFRNIFHVFSTIYHREGVLAFYRGFLPTMIGIIPYAGTSFSTYEMLKKYRADKAQKEGLKPTDPSPYQRLIFGGIAGLLGQGVSYPLDIVRRRMQTASQMGIDSNRYKSIIGTLRIILKKEGFRKGWFKGYSMNFIKGPIAAGISFMAYDYCRVFWQKILL